MLRGRFNRLLGLPMLALGCIAALCCCASSAQASCGDYLSHAGEMTSPQQGDSNAPAVPTAPCRGPHCRQAPDHAPLPAPQRVVVVPTRDILGLTVTANELALDAQWFSVPSETCHPSFCGLSLFRPPRLVA